MNDNTTPQETQDMLNEITRSIQRPAKAKKIFLAVPNMNSMCLGLINKLFHFAMQKQYEISFHFTAEKRHTDYARNLIATEFLATDCETLVMIDHDVDPHPALLELVELDKDIASANVFCWINGELMASIWQRSECEQCKNVRVFMETGNVHDASQYRINPKFGSLDRWNPFISQWQQFARKDGLLGGVSCRCKATGMDPWVFRTLQIVTPNLTQVDSVGSAAMVIQRRVIERMPFPWFRFLYRESGEILLTEDHYFCWKAGECEFQVWAHPNMTCSHYKTVDLLQITGTINKAYEMGRTQEKIKQSIEIP